MSRAKQVHREEVFRAFFDEETHMVPCYFADEGNCRGELQAAHIIGVHTLRRLYSQAVILEDTIGECRPILEAEIDELIADPRNGVPACAFHHAQHEGPVLHCDAPELFHIFVADYGLEHVIDNAKTAA